MGIQATAYIDEFGAQSKPKVKAGSPGTPVTPNPKPQPDVEPEKSDDEEE